MARYNIESNWNTDPRRTSLAKKIGGERLADGMLLEVIRLVFAHSKDDGLIPYAIFKHVENAQDFIDCDLAVLKDDCVYVRGSSKYSEFFEKQHANGKKGGRPKKNPEQPTAETDNPNKPKITQTNPSEPSVTLNNPSISFSISKERTTTTDPRLLDQVSEAWGAWVVTMASFGVTGKNISESDQRTLFQAIRTLGFTRVQNALIGKRYEVKQGNYDPKNTLSLEYCLSRNAKTGTSSHERLENLALAHQSHEAKSFNLEDIARGSL